jgi:hypothetical protein
MTQKFSIEAQLEEVRMAIDDYKYLAIKSSVKEFRANRLRSVCRTLGWVQENEAAIRHWLAEQKSVAVG